MLTFERAYYEQGYRLIVGCDEAGRGPLAGPVVAAAVILPSDYQNEDIDDSKKLSAKKRLALFEEIQAHAIAWGVGIVDAETIDRINIYQASRMAMNLAIEHLEHDFEIILTDAMPLKGYDQPVIDIIKGDAKAMCIAAASIIAKVTRDQIMEQLDQIYPQYGFASHKGYGTKEHLLALEKYGPIKGIHRYTYGPVLKAQQIQISLFD